MLPVEFRPNPTLLSGEQPSLPYLTPMSISAYQKLTQWGLNTQQIATLREFVGYFKDAYKHCPEKVAAISSVYIDRDPEDMEWATIPSFYNFTGSPHGGNCIDLSLNLFFNLSSSAFLAQLNQGKHRFDIARVYGTSPIHFNHSRHYWCGLVKNDPFSGYRSNNAFKKMVVLDPAYQAICTEDDGYGIQKLTWDSLNDKESEISVSTKARMTVFNREKAFKKVPNGASTAVLGISQDGELSYGLGFLKKGDDYRPFIRAVCENGNDYMLAYIQEKYSTTLTYHFPHHEFLLSLPQLEEMEEMLIVADQRFEYKDAAKVPQEEIDQVEREMTIKWTR